MSFVQSVQVGIRLDLFMMDPSVVRFLAVKSTRCSGGYMAKDSSSNFSGKCKGWPRGKAAGVAKMERLTSPFIIPFLAFKFAENPDAMGYMGRVPCQSRIVVSGSNILMVVWPNGEMVRVPPKRNTCGRICSVIPCLSPFLPVLFFYGFLGSSMRGGQSSLATVFGTPCHPAAKRSTVLLVSSPAPHRVGCWGCRSHLGCF